MNVARPAVLALASLAFASCQSTDLVEPRTPTPQRPTVSQNTQTTAFGTVQLEAGAEWDPNDRFEAPLTARWGLSEKSEFFVGWSPFIYQDNPFPDDDGDGVGDVSFGFKERLMDETDRLPATAFLLQATLPVGEDEDGVSQLYESVHAAAIADKSFGPWNTTGYYRLGLVDNATPSDLDVEHVVAAAVNRRLADKVVGLAEVSLTSQPEIDIDQFLLTMGGYYELTELFWLDAGFRLGLSEEAEDFVLFAGFTTNFGRLF